MEIRTAPRAAAQKAMRDKLEKQARDISVGNNYVNQNDEPSPENYGTEQVKHSVQRAETMLHTTVQNQTHAKAASPKREAAYRFMKRKQTRKAAGQVQQRTAVIRKKAQEITVRVGKAVGEAVVKSFQSMRISVLKFFS